MKVERVFEIISNFSKKRVCVVGDILLDSYLFGTVSRVNPERPGYPVLKVERSEYRLGGAANVAVNLASLGAEVSLFGLLGNDSNGKIVKRLCKKRKVNCIAAGSVKTLLKQRRIELTHNDYLGREDFGETFIRPIGKKAASFIFDNLIRMKPEVIVFSDYNKGVFQKDLGKRIISWARRNGILVVVDPKPANVSEFIGASVFRPNRKEAFEIVQEQELEKAVMKIKKKLKSDYVAITCGGDGMVYLDGKIKKLAPTMKKLGDSTGAGDTFISAIALSMASGANFDEAVRIANYASGIVVEKLGTAYVTNKELMERIRRNI